MYTFRQIREAVVAGGRPAGFPHGAAFDAEHLAALRHAPHLQRLFTEVRELAQVAQAEPITTLPFGAFKLFEISGTRKEYENPYFARRGRLVALVLTAVLDADDTVIAALEDLLWAICDEYTWCVPAHLRRHGGDLLGARLTPEQMVDLFAAETSHALAETLLLLDERLHPWVRDRVRAEIERRIFQPLFHDPIHFHWESVPMNWASVCAGAAGMAALALEPDSERLAGMIERCCRAMECFMEGFGPDGGCAEGIGYWQYGFGYYVYFAEMLRDYTGGTLDLLASDLARRVAAFPVAVSLGGSSFVNYSDGSNRMQLAPGLLSRLATRLGTPVPELTSNLGLHADHCYRWPHLLRNISWSDPAIFGRPTPSGTILLDHLGWVIDRRQAGDVMLAFSARAGHNAEPHNQNDLGHFILHVGGESLLVDLGAGLYTRQYFGPQRYDHIHNSSAGHSVPYIDSHTQQPGQQYRAELLECTPTETGVIFAVELARAYELPSLQQLTRRFAWSFDAASGTATLQLSDSFRFTQPPARLDEHFISLHQPQLAEGQVVWRGARGSVTLAYDPAAYSAAVEAIESHDHQGDPITIYRLRLRVVRPAPESICAFTFICRGA
ncbi:MAG TPA: heparinase II/III family protein [Roseiflexaceae bacterium]|nr:heparinase II/III family protein [Roseiflexaceae bacterium]